MHEKLRMHLTFQRKIPRALNTFVQRTYTKTKGISTIYCKKIFKFFIVDGHNIIQSSGQ